MTRYMYVVLPAIAIITLLVANASATGQFQDGSEESSWLSTGLLRMKQGRLHAAHAAFQRSEPRAGERARELANAALIETSINLRYCLMTLFEIGYDPMHRERALARGGDGAHCLRRAFALTRTPPPKSRAARPAEGP